MKRWIGFVALWALVLGASSLRASAEPASVPGEIVVQFRANASASDQQRARGKASAKTKEVIRDAQGKGKLELESIPPGQTVSAAKRALEADPAVAFAEPNWIYEHEATSNDPYYTNGSLWGMYGDGTTPTNQYGSQAGEAWAAGSTGKSTVYVGVIDEGLQWSHPDLAANGWVNSQEIVNGKDDDGNGFVDDVRGWDFVNNDNTVYDGGTQGKLDAHGTHVSGTIGASGGNAAGVVGINWNVKIISCKFLGRNGGTLANAVKAVNYLVDLKTRQGLNIVACNNSWGGGGYSQALLDAITRAAKANILFIAAASNDGTNNDTTVRYPSNYNTTTGTLTESAADYDSVIAVAALTCTGAMASYSKYGASTVVIGAPGSAIYSTLPYNKYGSYSGTSMATPHVTGAAALYASTRSGASARAIKAAILATAAPTASLNGKTVTGGRLNLGALLSGIVGQITNSATNAPVAGATVQVVGTNRSATTNASGFYAIDAIAPGNYSLNVSANGFDSQSTGATVVNGAPTTMNFALNQGSAIVSGTVTDSVTGSPLANVAITLTGLTPGTTSTDANGFYSFSNLLAGSYTVAAALDGYTGQSTPASVGSGAAVTQDFALVAIAPVDNTQSPPDNTSNSTSLGSSSTGGKNGNGGANGLVTATIGQ
jgi:subtilisin family serine protease